MDCDGKGAGEHHAGVVLVFQLFRRDHAARLCLLSGGSRVHFGPGDRSRDLHAQSLFYLAWQAHGQAQSSSPSLMRCGAVRLKDLTLTEQLVLALSLIFFCMLIVDPLMLVQ